MSSDSPLTGPGYEKRVRDLQTYFEERVQFYYSRLMAGGYPPMYTPAEPEEQMERLMMAQGTPRWSSKAAAALRDIEQRARL